MILWEAEKKIFLKESAKERYLLLRLPYSLLFIREGGEKKKNQNIEKGKKVNGIF